MGDTLSRTSIFLSVNLAKFVCSLGHRFTLLTLGFFNSEVQFFKSSCQGFLGSGR